MAGLRAAIWLALAMLCAGCGPSIGTSPNTFGSAVESELPSGYGLYAPHPENAGIFVKTKTGMKYFDENGYVHRVYEDPDPDKTFYVAWESGRSWLIFLNADGTFPTLEQGRKRNVIEATPVLRASRQISWDQIDGCIAQAKKDFGRGKPLEVAGEFEVDEARIYRGPRLPVEVQAPVRAGPPDASGALDQLVCEFDVVDGAPVFRAARILTP